MYPNPANCFELQFTISSPQRITPGKLCTKIWYMAITAPIKDKGNKYFLTLKSLVKSATAEITACGYIKALWYQHNLHGAKLRMSDNARLESVAPAEMTKINAI